MAIEFDDHVLAFLSKDLIFQVSQSTRVLPFLLIYQYILCYIRVLGPGLGMP